MLLIFVALVGMSTHTDLCSAEEAEGNFVAYENPTTIEERNLTFNMEQNVSGNGFFSAYKYSLMPDDLGPAGHKNNGVEAKMKAHGSGKMDMASIMYAESSYLNRTWINGAYDEDGKIIEDEEDSTSIIQTKEDGQMTHSPSALTVGSGYYTAHPLIFKSLFSDETKIMNRDTFSSIHNRVERAQGLDINLETDLDYKNTSMNLNEDMINGNAHFSAIRRAGNSVDPENDDSEEDETDEAEPPVLGPAMKAWHEPTLMMETDYTGTYHIETNLKLYTEEEDPDEEEDYWLPCCSGGFLDMNLLEQFEKKSARGIFDCTCFLVPKAAQFSKI
ncbi:Uncharacterised protein [uncultured archaeon]|nr:Uncharacterised protein [uncultured archaeon]